MAPTHSSAKLMSLVINGCPAHVRYDAELGLYRGVFSDIPSIVFYAETESELHAKGELALKQRLIGPAQVTLENERWLE